MGLSRAMANLWWKDFYILHEGLIGVPGAHNLQEFTYDNIAKEASLTGSTRGKVWKAATGGFVGITDKYWAAAIIPDQNIAYDARFSHQVERL
jgi:YidC/Oxa1 family membrane protein insertase